MTCSIPNEHVPVYTSQLIPRGHEYPGVGAIAGALRGGTWDVDFAGAVLWTWVFLWSNGWGYESADAK